MFTWIIQIQALVIKQSVCFLYRVSLFVLVLVHIIPTHFQLWSQNHF
jgi:hypothetical protein